MTFVPALIGNFYPPPEGAGSGGRGTFVILKFKIQFTCVINLIAQPEAPPQAQMPVDFSICDTSTSTCQGLTPAKGVNGRGRCWWVGYISQDISRNI